MNIVKYKNKLKGSTVQRTVLSKFISTTSLAFGMLLLQQVAYAANVQNLILSGNSNVTAQIIFENLELKKGHEITEASINASIASLHATGLFQNVSITHKGSTVYITVDENPIINSIQFIGNKNLSSGLLNSVIDLRPNGYFTTGRIQQAITKIKKKYTDSRYSNVQVSHNITSIDDDRADLVFTITEGASTSVQKVSFVGNSVFSDGALRGVVSTKEATFFSFLTGGDTYNADKVNFDHELLRRFYLEHGYADFSVISAVADLDEDSNKYFITFTVDEGEQYKFGDVDVDSAFSNLSPEELLPLVRGRTGETYNALKLNDTISAIRQQASRRGYSFAKITPVISRDPISKTISIVYTVEGGERVYVDRISIIGNVRTHDQVIRREIKIAEGDAFSAEAMERAKNRLMKTGHFSGVSIRTEPGSASDRIVVIVEVAETATGSVGASGSYSTLSGLVGELSYAETNLLGTGQQLNASIKWSQNEKSATFGFTDPYFMGSDFAVGASAFASIGDDIDSNRHWKTGTGVSVGIPVGEFTTLTTNYNFTYDNNRTTATTDYISALGVNLTIDTRDKFIMPTEGYKLEADVELAGLGGNVQYIRAVGKAEGHFEIVSDVILSAYVQGGSISSWGGATMRKQDTFFKGGDLVRGFAADGFGPRNAGGTAEGGMIYAGATAEITVPLIKSAGIYGGLFADAGTLYSSSIAGALSNTNELRSSIGASIIWHSPIGPLRADYAYVLTKNAVDEVQPFKFGLAIRY